MKSAISQTRKKNFSKWYLEVIKEAGLAENSPVRGCMVIKPWGYAIWERIQSILDSKIKESGHENVYFPLLIPLSFFEKEAEHVDGFATECAVVTHHRLEKDSDGSLQPQGELDEPYVIRPTSEMIIGDTYSRWVQSYRDLPLLLNQWANVMRWEMRTRLFLRTSEFLWQEGHTAHATSDEAIEETLQMLKMYDDFAAEYMAMPVIRGEKTPEEKFPGAQNTYAIESLMQDGKALQAGTSHFFGQRFAKASNIKFLDKDNVEKFAWTTSWGVSTRLIGGLIMTHSDDNGLVLPPKIAPQQIAILPIYRNEEQKEFIIKYCNELKNTLDAKKYSHEKLRVYVDNRDLKGGTKYWSTVKKGVPVCVEIGMKEIDSDNVCYSCRSDDELQKKVVPLNVFVDTINFTLNEIQDSLYNKALAFTQSNTKHVNSLNEFINAFKDEGNGYVSCFVSVSPEDVEVREKITKELKVSARCIPLDDNDTGKCIFTNKDMGKKVLFAKAY